MQKALLGAGTIFAASAALVLTACQGSNGTATPALGKPQVASGAKSPASGSGTVIIPLVPIVSGTPQADGPVGLSAATQSVAGRVGAKPFGPIALNPANPQCSPTPAGLQCSITVTAAAGSQQAIAVNAFASGSGSGAGTPLALGTGTVSVFAGATNYASSLQWVGIARKFALVVQPPGWVRGMSGTSQVIPFGVDAGGAFIPNPTVLGPGSQPTPIASISVFASGPYRESFDTSLTHAGWLRYDGILSGTEKLVAKAGRGGVPPVLATLVIAPGTTSKAQIFVQPGEEPRLSYGDTTMGVAQFAASDSGNVPPIRNIAISPTLVAAQRDGTFWGLIGSVVHYDRFGKQIDYVPPAYPGGTPSNHPNIAAATVDAAGNAYVIDELGGAIPMLNVYAAGQYLSPPVRSLSVASGIAYLTVDAKGDVYLLEGCQSPSGQCVLEYGPTASGNDPPQRTIAVGPGAIGLAADGRGDVYTVECPKYGCLVNSQLIRYAPAGWHTTIESGVENTSYLNCVATDRLGNVYAGWQYRAIGAEPFQLQIQKFAPGAMQPSATIGGAATQLAYDDTQGCRIAVGV